MLEVTYIGLLLILLIGVVFGLLLSMVCLNSVEKRHEKETEFYQNLEDILKYIIDEINTGKENIDLSPLKDKSDTMLELIDKIYGLNLTPPEEKDDE